MKANKTIRNKPLKVNGSNTDLAAKCVSREKTNVKMITTAAKKNSQLKPLTCAMQNTYCSVKTLKILVARQDHTKLIAFVMRRTHPMKKLMKQYSKHIGVEASYLRFLFDGYRIDDTDTPESLQMKENDIIEVYKLAYCGGKCLFKPFSAK